MNPKIILKKPPSVNHLYAATSRGGFLHYYITREGKKWFLEAGEQLKKQWHKKKTIEGEIELFIELYTAYLRQDCDNIVKAIQDLLQKNAIIINDSQVFVLNVQKYKCSKKDERIELVIWDHNT